jgi:hypothetical protein
MAMAIAAAIKANQKRGVFIRATQSGLFDGQGFELPDRALVKAQGL